MTEDPKTEDRDSVAGRCLCGAITFELLFPSDFCSHCHCESCRRAHSAAFVTWTSVPQKQLVLKTQATLSRYESSPGVFRLFCNQCGSQLFYDATDTPEKRYVAVASLEGPLDRSPGSHVSYEESVAWCHHTNSLPKYKAKSDKRLDKTTGST